MVTTPEESDSSSTASSDDAGAGPRQWLPDAATRSQSSYQRPEGWQAPGAALVASAATEQIPAAEDLGRVHIMGIAGAGMSGLARIMLDRGLDVSGSEGRDSVTVTALRALGIPVTIGHPLSLLDDTDTLVYTTAINPRHEMLAAARSRGLRVIRRATGLAAMITGKRAVAIAGTHGKTTTTSLLTVAAQACGLDPSFAIGGNLYESGLNAHAGSGELFIVEADESDGSFLLLRPELAIVTNVEADHLENHGDLEGVFRAFELFVDRIDRSSPSGGLLLACADDAGARRIADYARAQGVPVRTYGTADDADVRVGDIIEHPDSVEFTVRLASGRSHRLRIGSLLGRHMALNAAAAFAVAVELGFDPYRVEQIWREFQGVHRRFEFHGEAGGVRVYDDYAHHPTEVRAALSAARSIIGEHAAPDGGRGRLVAIFQPGTFSRTQTFAQEFAEALAIADVAVVMDIFPAREEPIPGVTGALIAERIPLPADRLVYEPRWSDTAGRVAALSRAGDVVMTMGIGDVHLLCAEILALLGDGQPGTGGEQ
ncbi:UDP-N-acetylmuramate--L-alanine ligase [Jatrophihabitans telluris]|uniref:UDP-N-acetylmuramate--L-alanine ligase n=1 Tax=Jatrophihabitans telluris TaxID=2038343 RepID=A0ABY4QVN6_9ACTN|nr:UDP-N-acetylmuramate--L-alanine ligase [Jatrophihabitans telluris]UQX87187.1 UDP-N-acetylmuramate--L-alanine ligase [Jatrophihabitans telluris]